MVQNGLNIAVHYCKMDAQAIFEALPHVNTIWVVGENFHLHSDYGGEKIERYPTKKTELLSGTNEPIAQKEETQEIAIKPKGRPKHQNK